MQFFFPTDKSLVDVKTCFLFNINIHLVSVLKSREIEGGEMETGYFLISSDKKDYFDYLFLL